MMLLFFVQPTSGTQHKKGLFQQLIMLGEEGGILLSNPLLLETPHSPFVLYRLSRARMVTGAAYGQLKGRWRVLLRKTESSRDQARITTLACTGLHNICIMQGDAVSRKLDLSLDESGGKRNREELRKILQMRDCASIKDASHEATKVRHALSEKLWIEKQTGKV